MEQKTFTVPTIAELRGPKILDMSIFDWVSTLIGVLIIAWLIGIKTFGGFVILFACVIVIGVFVHLVAGVDTMFGYYIGVNPKPWREQPVAKWEDVEKGI